MRCVGTLIAGCFPTPEDTTACFSVTDEEVLGRANGITAGFKAGVRGGIPNEDDQMSEPLSPPPLQAPPSRQPPAFPTRSALASPAMNMSSTDEDFFATSGGFPGPDFDTGDLSLLEVKERYDQLSKEMQNVRVRALKSETPQLQVPPESNHGINQDYASGKRSRPSEVRPRLFLGTLHHALDALELPSTRFTHFVSATRSWDWVAGDDDLLRLSVDIDDQPSEDILRHFPRVCNFVGTALCGGGHVLVHCDQGDSRSVALAAAFLMKAESSSALDALLSLRSAGVKVRPNEGFLQALVEWQRLLRPRDKAPDISDMRDFCAEKKSGPRSEGRTSPKKLRFIREA